MPMGSEGAGVVVVKDGDEAENIVAKQGRETDGSVCYRSIDAGPILGEEGRTH